jgi:hypothetical protein
MEIRCCGTERTTLEKTKTTIKRSKFNPKMGNSWAVIFMRRKGLAFRRRTTLARKLPKDYVEKLIAYQRHIINLRRKHDYLLGQMGNAGETPVFFDTPTNTTVDTKSSKSIHVKTTGHEKLSITDAFSSG